jgi:hypothetical protein
MKPEERRKIGAHYTSERDILRVIHPLFLDSLRDEFASIGRDRSGRRANRLEQFRVRLTQLRFLDPACGCGNFLVIAYRELRVLELEVLQAQHSGQQAFTLDEVNRLSQVDVHQFYGIEVEEWPVRIAEVALWLMDHQSNLQILAAFSQPFLRLPLRNSPHIHYGNALRMDWNTLLPATECSYILGNPPFIGKNQMSGEQKKDMLRVGAEIGGVPGGGVLDYVAAWYFKAAHYQMTAGAPICFVSTNSITQGEQPALLWDILGGRFGLAIQFAYRTFPWESEARGKAHVHVIIMGLTRRDDTPKYLFDRDASGSQTHSVHPAITPYLLPGTTGALKKRSKPISDAPQMIWGSMPNDGGNLLLSPDERTELLRRNPGAAAFLRPIVGAKEFLHRIERWCLWFVGVEPSAISRLPDLLERIEKVRTYRLESDRDVTTGLASTPALFGEIRQPDDPYLLVPEASSELRRYIPMAMQSPEVICSNLAKMVPNATNYHFGVLTSGIHMAWVDVVAGRLKSDYRYSNRLVYNNYPWPQNPTPAQVAKVEELAQAVLDERARHPDSTLAELYDPLIMPPELVQAHLRLDRAVERCYRPEPFASDRERVEYLFSLYEQLSTPLLPPEPTPRRRRHRVQS